MNKKEARAQGLRIGYGIGEANRGSFSDTEEGREQYVSECLETECEHYRQFSPFEFLAAELNADEDRADGLWEAYESGVLRGIEDAWKAGSDRKEA